MVLLECPLEDYAG